MFDDVFDKDENEFVDLAQNSKYFFRDEVIERGEEYYNEGKVDSVTRLGNLFVSKVSGSMDYTVRISFDEDEESSEMLMSCNCPCEENCKHEYATLLAIENGDYDEKELMPYVDENNLTVEDLIKKIPAEALKKYLLSDNGMKYTSFDIDDLEKTFIEFIPKQEYNFYYNNLYNSFLLDDDTFELYYSYFDDIRKYIEACDFEQAFSIIKSIIEVGHDLNIDMVPDFPELGMYFRIAYRKADKEVKKVIEKYIMSLIFNHYYGNVYLEDMISQLN